MTYQFTPDDAGCIFDGAFGQLYNDLRTCELAVERGCTDTDVIKYSTMSEEDAENMDAFEELQEARQTAEDYLNTLTPDGYTFEWLDGDFVLIAETELENPTWQPDF